MKPFDSTDYDTTVEIIAIDPTKPDVIVWRCTEEQGFDWKEIKERVKAQGYNNFEKRITKVKEEYYEF